MFHRSACLVETGRRFLYILLDVSSQRNCFTDRGKLLVLRLAAYEDYHTMSLHFIL